MKKIILFILITCFNSIAFSQPNAKSSGAGGPINTLDGDGSLAEIYNNSTCGLNYTFASVRLRNRPTTASGGIDATNFPSSAQPATISISGIPAGATITKAFLWFTVEHANSNTSLITSTVSGTFINPAGTATAITASLVGKGTGTCSFGGGAASANANYRVDVTSLITVDGNYQVDGLPKPATSGVFTGNDRDTDGATLFIVYTEPGATYNGTVILHDGSIVSNTFPNNSSVFSIGGYQVCPSTTIAKAFISVTDFNTWVWMGQDTVLVNGVVNRFSDGKTYTSREFPINAVGCGNSGVALQVKPAGKVDCYSINFAGVYIQRDNCNPCNNTPFTITPNKTDPSGCNATNGTASAVASGGQANYTYLWNTGATGQTVNNLGAGTYTVTVNDANCNTTTQTVVLINSGGLNVTPSTINDATCGNSDGVAQVFGTTGGSAPYTHSWSNNFTGDFNPGLAAGTYTVTATDAGGCTGTGTVIITSGCGTTCTITANATVVSNLTCNGNAIGSATVTSTNGTAPLTYNWLNGATTQTATGLSALTYIVTVTDGVGCSATSSVLITQPPAIIVTPTVTPASCGNADGSINVSVSNATGTLTYSWGSSPVNASTLNGLSVGPYLVTVTDAQNCTGTTAASVSAAVGPTANPIVVNQPNCTSTTGSAIASASGGSGNYTFVWTGGFTGATISGLTPGGYTVTISDGSACTVSAQITINSAPAGFTLTPSSTATACGGGTGTVSVTATGATGVLTYTWSNALGSASGYTGVGAGTYTVTVTDGSGCTNSATATVGNTTGLSIGTPTVTQPTCAVPTGTIALSPSGGGTYTYAWSASAVTASSRSGLAAGSYTITVSDGSPCSATTAVVINAAPAGFTLTASSTATACGSNTGTISVTATGATGVITYTWSNALGSASGYTGVGIGTYTVTVADGSGCSATATTTVGNTTGLSIGTPTVTQPTCAVPTGTIALSPSGGGTYTYAWSASAVTASSRSGLAAGGYTITVTDGSPCSATTAVVINAAPTAFTLSTSTTPSSSCTTSNGTAAVTVTPAVGTYTYAWSGGLGAASAVTGLAGGTYSVTVSDGAGCSVSTTAIVSQVGSNLSVTTSSVNALCTAQNGSATAIPAGSSGYTYSWSSVPSQTGAVATSLGAGTYTVVVTDGGGCIVNATAVVGTSNGNIIINSNPTPSACGGSTGAAVANPIGGSTPYSYIWSSGATVQTATALAAGIYSVTVTDASGCSATTAVNVNSNGGLSVAATATSATCSLANGSVAATPSAGTPGPYTFTWMPGGATTQTVTGLTAANYTVTFTNGGNCPAGTASVAVGVTNTTGFVDFTLSATEATIVAPSFSFNSTSTNLQNWNWNFGDGSGTNSTDLNPSYTYTDTGRYCIKLIGINTDGCIDSAIKCVYIKPEFSLFIPNAFSPNKDGKNEVFLPKGFNVRKFKMMVFDRWGELIYVSEDFLKGWDGKANNGDEIAQQDVYTYIITADDPTGKKYRYIGHITLVK